MVEVEVEVGIEGCYVFQDERKIVWACLKKFFRKIGTSRDGLQLVSITSRTEWGKVLAVSQGQARDRNEPER